MNLQNLDLEGLFEAIAQASNDICRQSDDFEIEIALLDGAIRSRCRLWDKKQVVEDLWNDDSLLERKSKIMEQSLADTGIVGDRALAIIRSCQMLCAIAGKIPPSVNLAKFRIYLKYRAHTFYRFGIGIEWSDITNKRCASEEISLFELSRYSQSALWWGNVGEKFVAEINRKYADGRAV